MYADNIEQGLEGGISMKYKIEFNYRYGKDYVYCNEYREDEQFVQPLNSNGKPLCTIAKTNIIAIKEYK